MYRIFGRIPVAQYPSGQCEGALSHGIVEFGQRFRVTFAQTSGDVGQCVVPIPTAISHGHSRWITVPCVWPRRTTRLPLHRAHNTLRFRLRFPR